MERIRGGGVNGVQGLCVRWCLVGVVLMFEQYCNSTWNPALVHSSTFICTLLSVITKNVNRHK